MCVCVCVCVCDTQTRTHMTLPLTLFLLIPFFLRCKLWLSGFQNTTGFYNLTLPEWTTGFQPWHSTGYAASALYLVNASPRYARVCVRACVDSFFFGGGAPCRHCAHTRLAWDGRYHNQVYHAFANNTKEWGPAYDALLHALPSAVCLHLPKPIASRVLVVIVMPSPH